MNKRITLLIVAVALVPSLDAVIRLGRLHPDELFQSLEPATRLAFGYGAEAWEWQVGLRNYAVPGLFAALLKLAHAFGIDAPLARRAVLEVPQYALNVAMLFSALRLAERRVGSARAPWAVLLLLTWAPWVWFAGRTMSESMSAAFLVCALERLDDDRGSAITAGLLLGLAEIVRYGSAAFIIPALVFLATTRQWRKLALTVAGGLVTVLLLGLLDRLTWGAWFHSLREYLRFNVFTGGASSFGRLPPYWYLTQWLVAPLAVFGVAALAWRRDSSLRSPIIAWSVLVYFAAISITEHKELRFMYPAMLLALVAAAPAVVASRRSLALAAVALTLPLYLIKTPLDVERSDLFRATVKAGRDATGLIVSGEGLWGSAGTFYVGRDVPQYLCSEPSEPCFLEAMSDLRINRALYLNDADLPERNSQLAEAFERAGFTLSGRVGDAVWFSR